MGHDASVRSIKTTPDCKTAISASADNRLKLWDLKSGNLLATLRGHESTVYSVAITPNGKFALSGSEDNNLMLWDIDTKQTVGRFTSHNACVRSVAIMIKNKKLFAISGSIDTTLKIWDLSTPPHCLQTLQGHVGHIHTVAITSDAKHAISGADDKTLRLWSLEFNTCIPLRGHNDYIFSVDITPDNKFALSGAGDRTLKLWDLNLKRCVATFEGHTDRVYGVAIAPDGQIAASASKDGTVRIWNLETGVCLKILEMENREENQPWNVNFTLDGNRLLAGTKNGSIYLWHNVKEGTKKIKKIEQARYYTNAKVVLVGESGVGKTSLAFKLVNPDNEWRPCESSHGMQIWLLRLSQSKENTGVRQDVFLWDLAGQPEYRLIHQLFLEDTSLALVLYDPSHWYDPFRGIEDWERALQVALGHDPIKILVAARCDRGGTTLTQERIDDFLQEHNYVSFVSTSAKTGAGCKELKEFISNHIPWGNIPLTSTTVLFETLKEAITKYQEQNVCLIRFPELRQQLSTMLPDIHFEEEELRTVIKLLAGHGIIKQLSFGEFILLQPEQLNNYASAIIRAAKKNTDDIGAIIETEVLSGEINFEDLPRLKRIDEEILLRAIVQTFIDKSLCIREATGRGNMLVFPSQFKREMPEIPSYPDIFITYIFVGQLETIYTTLVVRFSYSNIFKEKKLWMNAAAFFTHGGERVGFIMNKVNEGTGKIAVFFDTNIHNDIKIIFIKYIQNHLIKYALDVKREREYICLRCNNPVRDRSLIYEGNEFVFCIRCGAKIILYDDIEEQLISDKFKKEVDEIVSGGDRKKYEEIIKLILKKHVEYIIASTKQIYRIYDNGIDSEIEFKYDDGKLSGKKIYLQLGINKQTESDKEGKDVFTITKTSHIEDWSRLGHTIFLIVLGLDEEIRWMDVSEYLKKHPDKKSYSVTFDGELFSSSNLMKVRKKLLFRDEKATEWGQIRFATTTDAMFEITINGHSKKFNPCKHKEIELTRASLRLLFLFIKNQGQVSKEDIDRQSYEEGYNTTAKHRISKLRCELKTLFGLDANPIEYDYRESYYVAQFQTKSGFDVST